MRAQEVFNVETSENNGGLLPLIYYNTQGPHFIASNGGQKHISQNKAFIREGVSKKTAVLLDFVQIPPPPSPDLDNL